MLAQIERAIAAAIRLASDAGALGYAFAAITSWDDAAAAMTDGGLAFPALWVAYDGENEPERLDYGCYRRRPTFVATVAAEQWLNAGWVRGRAVTGLPGAYQLVDDAWALLADRDLALPGVGPLRPGAIRPEINEQGLTLCHLDLTCELTAAAAPIAGDIADYLRHHIDWDIEPHGDVTTPLPAAVADTRDDIALPGPS